MTMAIPNLPDTAAPTEADTRLAEESSRRLARVLSRHCGSFQITIHAEGENDETVTIPAPAVQLLTEILTQMSQGNAVAAIPVQAELTTQQAADLLNVSRPFLVRLIEEGTIPCRKVGTHRRIRFKDVVDYKRSIDEKRLGVLEELSAQAQQLDMGY